jgi:hypothetical protein
MELLYLFTIKLHLYCRYLSSGRVDSDFFDFLHFVMRVLLLCFISYDCIHFSDFWMVARLKQAWHRDWWHRTKTAISREEKISSHNVLNFSPVVRPMWEGNGIVVQLKIFFIRLEQRTQDIHKLNSFSYLILYVKKCIVRMRRRIIHLLTFATERCMMI